MDTESVPTRRPEVLAATPTAFDERGRLDATGCAAVFSWLALSDLDGVFINGTAAEFTALTRAERRTVVELAHELIPLDKCVMVHVGAGSIYEVAGLLEDARSLGAAKVSVITPYFLPADPGVILEFYRRVSEMSDGLDVYPYLYRRVTGNEVDERLLRRLAELPNMRGAKISGESIQRIGRYVATCPQGFSVYAGLDAAILQTAQLGGRGVIAAMSAALPKPFARLARAVTSRDGEEIGTARAEVNDVCRALRGNTARIKAALRMQGIPVGRPRVPVEEPGPDALREIERIVSLHGATGSAPMMVNPSKANQAASTGGGDHEHQ